MRSDADVKNDLTLARYTCIALQRLGGSAKKVKGVFDAESSCADVQDHSQTRPCGFQWTIQSSSSCKIWSKTLLGRHSGEIASLSIVPQLSAGSVWQSKQSTQSTCSGNNQISSVGKSSRTSRRKCSRIPQTDVMARPQGTMRMSRVHR